MTAREIGALSPEDARFVLETMRRVHQSGLLNKGQLERKLNNLPRFSGEGGEGTELRFARIMGPPAGVVFPGKFSNEIGEYNPEGEDIDLINWQGLLDDAPEGYVGLFASIDDQWVFVQGSCIAPTEEEE